MINISDLRIAWIWTETFPGLLADPPQLAGRWGAPGSDAAYATAFHEARAKKGTLRLPWSEHDPKHQHFFWQYYLENDNPFEVTAGKALRWLVPLREPGLARIGVPGWPGWFTVDSYHYPHGLGLVFGMRIKADLPLFDMIEKAFDVARGEKFAVVWGDKSTEQTTLAQFGPAALDRLRASTFGKQTPQGVRSGKPFTVATAIQGSIQAGTEDAPEKNPDLHRALDALASWNPNWKNAVPSPLAQRRLPIRKAPASHTLYGLTSGRTVWFPDSFEPNELEMDSQGAKPAKKASLSCYHRNLIFTSLQTESLARLMSAARQVWQDGQKMSPSMRRLVKSACGILGRMYGGDKSVYSSFSPAMQLEDNGWIPVLQAVRNEFGMLDPLHRERPPSGSP
jgi:hypothetical protein